MGGVGGGTALIAAAQHIGTDKTWGQVLLYLSPMVSVALGSVIYYCFAQMNWMVLVFEVKRAKRTLLEQLEDPNVSDQVKEDIRRDLDEIDRRLSSARLARVRAASKSMDKWLAKSTEVE
ncbi:hypothetical protein NE235_14840 [Actinoallomurus spadix]|uniref:Uncharacterized protein n=1 Tax=Actinoallomurus spadix TaxID=79912 RepID=A0ABN0WFL9_9ACTN|nr:hypothetical protein [Actinoallomurus spadix]MCO5987381.1 hypothetical protein [Actinoallomurus spadix]